MSKQNEIAEVSKRIEQRTKLQALMKAANKVIKSKKLNNEQKVAELTDSLEFTKDQAIDLLQPDYANRIGFASYKLSTNNQEINRLKKRLTELESRYRQSKEGNKTWEFDGGSFETDYDDDRVKIYFDDIPDTEMRSKLKGSGWRWSRKNTAWQRQITDNAIRSAKQITGASEAKEDNLSPEFIDYKGTQIMYEPHNKEYFVVNEEWERNNQFGYKTKDEAKQWIDEVISRDEILSEPEMEKLAPEESQEQSAIDEMFKFKANDKVRSKEDGEIYIVKSVLSDGKLVIVHPDKTYIEYIEERENYEPFEETLTENLKTERNVGAGAYENWEEWDKFQSDVTDLLEDDVPRSDAQGIIEANNSTFKGFYDKGLTPAQAIVEFWSEAEKKQEIIEPEKEQRPPHLGFWKKQVTDIYDVPQGLQIALKYSDAETADAEIKNLKPSIYTKIHFSGSKDVVPKGRDLQGNPLPKGWYLINAETNDILTNGEKNKNHYRKREERGDIQTTVLKVKTIAPENELNDATAQMVEQIEKAKPRQNRNEFGRIEPKAPSSFNNQFELNEAIKKWLDDRGITAENANKRTYTETEKKFLKAYTGYGGLGKQDKESSADVLRIMEFYTPLKIIQTMWGLAYKNGFKETGSVLETSAGTGEFLQYAQRASRVMAIEVSRYSSAICKILYPSAEVLNQPFEKTFIDKNYTIKDKTENLPKFDLCIGNPPYASFDRLEKSASRYLLGMGEKDHTKAKNYVEYFLRRSVDMLKPDGLLIQIVGAELMNGGQLFLDSDNSPVKTWLAQNCELVEAYRLPAGVFETTNVTSEILVIRKKSTT